MEHIFYATIALICFFNGITTAKATNNIMAGTNLFITLCNL